MRGLAASQRTGQLAPGSTIERTSVGQGGSFAIESRKLVSHPFLILDGGGVFAAASCSKHLRQDVVQPEVFVNGIASLIRSGKGVGFRQHDSGRHDVTCWVS